MFRFVLLLVFIHFAISGGIQAQGNGLKIGDQLPEIDFGKILNRPGERITKGNLKGKLIILDFWNIHCKNCIAAMPKMDSLQQLFEGKLQIISVTGNSESQVNQLFSRIKILKPGFPFIVGDTVFNSLFPHEGDPLHVWIDEKGVVIAITNDYNTTKANIEKHFAGIMPNLPRRWDFGINTGHPLVSEVNGGLLNYVSCYSALFKSLHEFSSSNSVKETDTTIQVINGTLMQLYKIAFKNELYEYAISLFDIPTEDRTLLLVKDSSPFRLPTEEEKLSEWISKYKFCYEMQLSFCNVKNRYEFMQQDLLRFFPYNANIEKRKVRCLALTMLQDSKPGTAKPVIKGKAVYFENRPIEELVIRLASVYAWKGIPVIDETGLNGNFTFYLNSKLSDLDSLNNALKYYNLKLIPKDAEINFLVISDK
jgi:thiol-disulfide isomerase/thioredoxin